MTAYRVLFYKTLLNSEGHDVKCLEQEIDVQCESPSAALVIAENQIELRMDADCIEVIRLPDRPLTVSPAA